MKANLFLVIAACLWGLNFHLGKVILTEVEFVEAGFWRYLFGVITLLIVSIRKIPSLTIALKNRKGIMRVGIIGLFGFNFFFFLGLQYSSAINAALIISLNPAITVILSKVILKTAIRRVDVLGILIALVGTAYLTTSGSLIDLSKVRFNYGDILMLIANVFFALHHVWVKKYGSTISNSDFTILTNLICLMCFLLLAPFFKFENVFTHTPSFWISVLCIGGLGTSLAYIFWNKGVQLTNAHTAGVFMNVVPLSTAFLAFAFNEHLFQYHFIGGAIIMTGVVIMKLKK